MEAEKSTQDHKKFNLNPNPNPNPNTTTSGISAMEAKEAVLGEECVAIEEASLEFDELSTPSGVPFPNLLSDKVQEALSSCSKHSVVAGEEARPAPVFKEMRTLFLEKYYSAAVKGKTSQSNQLQCQSLNGAEQESTVIKTSGVLQEQQNPVILEENDTHVPPWGSESPCVPRTTIEETLPDMQHEIIVGGSTVNVMQHESIGDGINNNTNDYHWPQSEDVPVNVMQQQQNQQNQQNQVTTETPDEYKMSIQRLHNASSGLKLVIKKKLFRSDVSTNNCRLSLPVKHISPGEFLNEGEMRTAETKEEDLMVALVGPDGEEYSENLKLALWKSNNQYVLKGKGWNAFVKHYGLEKGNKVELWSFRKPNQQLCFALYRIDHNELVD